MSSGGGSRARVVALGMLASKVCGLVREMAISRAFGVGPHVDVIRSALRAPNLLQNLLGEQALSASFIPVYSRLIDEGREEEAGKLAGGIFGFLLVVVALATGLGVLFAPVVVAVLTPGFLSDAAGVASGDLTVDRFQLTVSAVRIIFPMTGLLVLSAWALGILNSHRRFFLPYFAPALWNTSIVTALAVAAWQEHFLPGTEGLQRMVMAVCFGALIGGGLQFSVQIPSVLRLVPKLRFGLSTKLVAMRQVLTALGPAVLGRGVVQLSGYIDIYLSSFLQPGALSAIGFAMVLVGLPLGAFGVSVAASELPELSRAEGKANRPELATRLSAAIGQTSFVVCPAMVGYLVFGPLVVGVVYGGGKFDEQALVLVRLVLCGYCLGLVPSAISRLLQNGFFACRDTKTPARIGAARLLVSAVGGALLMRFFDTIEVSTISILSDHESPLFLGALGLSLASSLGAWLELGLLWTLLRRKLPELAMPVMPILASLTLAVATAALAGLVWWLMAPLGRTLVALVVLPVFIASYLAYSWWRKWPALNRWLSK